VSFGSSRTGFSAAFSLLVTDSDDPGKDPAKTRQQSGCVSGPLACRGYDTLGTSLSYNNNFPTVLLGLFSTQT